MPQQRPDRAEQGAQRPAALPGEWVTRRSIRHREHEVRAAGVGGSIRGESGSPVIASPQMTCRGRTSLLLATYRVRPATRTWLGAGGPDPGGAERIAVQFRPLDHPYPGRVGDPWAVTLLVGPEQDGYGLAVPGGQLLDDPAGERVFPADDEMVAAGRDQGKGGTA